MPSFNVNYTEVFSTRVLTRLRSLLC